MKKYLLAAMTCCCLFVELRGQVSYYDALFIKDSLMSNGRFKRDSNSLKTLAGVLRNYCPTPIRDNPNATTKAIISFFILDQDNKFFKLIDSNIVNASEEIGSFAKKISSLLGKVGGIDVTTFADGAAKFLVERAKEEFNVAFFQKLKELSKEYPEFKTLF
jgi:hypothetical protein